MKERLSKRLRSLGVETDVLYIEGARELVVVKGGSGQREEAGRLFFIEGLG